MSGLPALNEAVTLLGEFRLDATLSKRQAIALLCQQWGLVGPERRSAARTLAEGWQLLEHARLICPDPDDERYFFLTRAGRAVIGDTTEIARAIREAVRR